MTEQQRFEIRLMVNQTSTRNLKILYNKMNDEYIKSAINLELIQRATDKIDNSIKAKEFEKLDQIFNCCENNDE